MSEEHISNAGIILKVHCRDGKIRIVVVQLKSGKWTNPGGKVNAGESAFNAARREYEEETGMILPHIIDMNSIIITHRNGSKTKIYYGHTRELEDNFRLNVRNPRFNHETIDLKLYTYERIIQFSARYTDYFIKSLIIMNSKGMVGGAFAKAKYIKYNMKIKMLLNHLI